MLLNLKPRSYFEYNFKSKLNKFKKILFFIKNIFIFNLLVFENKNFKVVVASVGPLNPSLFERAYKIKKKFQTAYYNKF